MYGIIKQDLIVHVLKGSVASLLEGAVVVVIVW